jgi:flagellar assembly protein FliH
LEKEPAERFSEQMRAELEQEAYCRGFSDGKENGFELGERSGREAANVHLESVLKCMEKMLADLQCLQNNLCRNLEKDAVQLVLDVARKIVGRAVQIDVQGVTRIVRSALSRIEHAESITIRMNPSDMQRLAECAPHQLAELTGAQRVRFEGDESISSGGCCVESDSGEIDARLERRFKAVEDAFQAEWSNLS